MQRSLQVPEPVLVALLTHAASAARIVGHLDDAPAIGPLGDHIDAIFHELTELLGDPHTLAVLVPSARSIFDDTPDAVPEHVATDPPDDETTQPHIAFPVLDATRGAS